jgi:hypothetical protein
MDFKKNFTTLMILIGFNIKGKVLKKVGRKTVHQPTIGKHSLHEVNESTSSMVSDRLALPHAGKWRSKVRTSKSQIFEKSRKKQKFDNIFDRFCLNHKPS